MQCKPILFNTQMVQAILRGEKTATRRLIKLPGGLAGFPVGSGPSLEDPLGFQYPGGILRPRYLPGDILYVRETWQYAYDLDGNERIIEETGRYLYAADGPAPFNMWITPEGEYRDSMPWKPSIHMPKAAARIFLKVTDVRVEHLRAISIEDIRKEGIRLTPREEVCRCAWETENCRQEPCANRDAFFHSVYISKFANLWNSTIKDDRYLMDSFTADPWVWAYEFKRCEKPKETEEDHAM